MKHEYHQEAANHCVEAAYHYKKAHEYHKMEEYHTSAHHAQLALGHLVHAETLAAESAKHHVKHCNRIQNSAD